MGHHEPGLAESDWAHQGLRWGSAHHWLVHVWMVPSQSHVSTRPQAKTVWVGTMSTSMSKTFMSPDFLTKFLEEYCELPVLWQVSSADYSNRAKWDEAWDLLLQFTREKIADAYFCFLRKKYYHHCCNLFRWIHSGYWNVRSKLGVRSCTCGEIYLSPAPESSLLSQTRTCMGTLRAQFYMYSCLWRCPECSRTGFIKKCR